LRAFRAGFGRLSQLDNGRPTCHLALIGRPHLLFIAYDQGGGSDAPAALIVQGIVADVRAA
jgi:hypothetical protein